MQLSILFAHFMVIITSVMFLLFVTCCESRTSTVITRAPTASEKEKENVHLDKNNLQIDEENAASSSVNLFDINVKSDQINFFLPTSTSSFRVDNESKSKSNMMQKRKEKKEEEEEKNPLIHSHSHLTLKRSTQVPMKVQDERVLEQALLHENSHELVSTFVSLDETTLDTSEVLRIKRDSFTYHKKKEEEEEENEQQQQQQPQLQLQQQLVQQKKHNTQVKQEVKISSSVSSNKEGNNMLHSINETNFQQQVNNFTSKSRSKRYTWPMNDSTTPADTSSSSSINEKPNDVFLGVTMSKSDFSSILCRSELGFPLPLPQYTLHTCGKCYFYLPDWAFKPGRKLR